MVSSVEHPVAHGHRRSAHHLCCRSCRPLQFLELLERMKYESSSPISNRSNFDFWTVTTPVAGVCLLCCVFVSLFFSHVRVVLVLYDIAALHCCLVTRRYLVAQSILQRKMLSPMEYQGSVLQSKLDAEDAMGLFRYYFTRVSRTVC